jgi:DNA-binding PadR family transcriptional regulator
VPRPRTETSLTPAAFQILLALVEGDRHGYGIMQAASEGSGGRTRLGPGTLYGTIRRLLDAGLIEEADERPDPDLDDERRRYYRLTSRGRRAAESEARHLEELVRQAQAARLLPLPGGVK